MYQIESFKYDRKDRDIEIDDVYQETTTLENEALNQKSSYIEKVIQDKALFRNYESKPIKALNILRSRLGPFQTYVFDMLRGLEPPDIAREVAKEEDISFEKAFARIHRALRIIREKAKLIGEIK